MWLVKKAEIWSSTYIVYQSVETPDYQLDRFIVNDPKEGRYNILIYVPDYETENRINEICQEITSTIDNFRILIINIYKRNILENKLSKDYWQYVHNNNNGYCNLSYLPYITEDSIKENHFFGIENYKLQKTIPQNWFGDNEENALLGKNIWENDKDHLLILHPYVNEAGNNKFFSIYFMKKLDCSKSYQQFINNLVLTIPKNIKDHNNIWITVYLRDTSLGLVSFNWYKEHNFFDYKDEFMKSNKVVFCKELSGLSL